MLIGERRVPFDTLVSFIPGSLHGPMYLPPKYKMAAQCTVIVERMLDFSLEDEGPFNSDDDGIPFVAGVATYMRRHLPRNKGFYENIFASLTIDEFKSHFRMTRGTFEAVPRSTSHRKSS